MKHLTLGSILLVWMIGVMVWATPVQEPSIYPTVIMSPQALIDVLSEYRILHEDADGFCSSFWGTTDYRNRTITLCNQVDSTAMKMTLIHEVLHVLYWKKGIKTNDPVGEAVVAQRAMEVFQELYGL